MHHLSLKSAALSLAVAFAATMAGAPAIAQQSAQPTPAERLLTPDNHTLILIDHQSRRSRGCRSRWT